MRTWLHLVGFVLTVTGLAASASAEATRVLPPTPNPSCPDGRCFAREAEWGYYQGRWRRWPGDFAEGAARGPTPEELLQPELNRFESPPAEQEELAAPPPVMRPRPAPPIAPPAERPEGGTPALTTSPTTSPTTTAPVPTTPRRAPVAPPSTDGSDLPPDLPDLPFDLPSAPGGNNNKAPSGLDDSGRFDDLDLPELNLRNEPRPSRGIYDMKDSPPLLPNFVGQTTPRAESPASNPTPATSVQTMQASDVRQAVAVQPAQPTSVLRRPEAIPRRGDPELMTMSYQAPAPPVRQEAAPRAPSQNEGQKSRSFSWTDLFKRRR